MNPRNTLAVILLIAFPLQLQAAKVDFVHDVRPIFEKYCYDCHGSTKQKSGLRLDIKSAAFKGGDGYAPIIVPGKSDDSPLVQFIRGDDKEMLMPPKGTRLSANEIATVAKWVDEGAIWPDGVDLVKIEDRRDHWSFKPLTQPVLPEIRDKFWPRDPIDRFILARLEKEGLKPALEADRVTWIRRVTLDLTGLPPTPEQVSKFVGDQRPDAYKLAVDELLESPRYGERWAQHWLDVVRYADTHGFEVNTERPNAWPYRDYVIRAMNRDTPGDRFIREQIIGDQLGEDAATGFLVTASVLLPGQIGADEPSKRLARQDALDEIVMNIGQSFMGLSIGCARCHDHKFDPISQREYYAMQAFVAGVEYEDRDMRTPEAKANQMKAESLKKKVVEIDQQLARFEPLANIDPTRRITSPKLNEEVFKPIKAKFVRFSIHDTNLHPALGLIEPCIDEFEILSDEPTPRNLALASFGTKVTASGSRTSEIHRLDHINDGRYGNSRSWMSDEAGRGWVVFELPEATRIGKIRWSRDRDGVLNDRLPTAYSIEAGPKLDEMQSLVSHAPLRPQINARSNSDRFAAVKTKKIRFTIHSTNNLEPCIDELEVFTREGQNVALAKAGTKATSSGDNVVPDRHELNQINDGRYGNSRSWMSNEFGKGWVVLEFEKEQTIERVVWGRDREGEYADRLATDYRVEVADGSGQWRKVASSADRNPFKPGGSRNANVVFSTAGLQPEEARQANALISEKKQLEQQIKTATSAQKAFAGVFRKPDTIRLLSRGDPEQPKDEVAPALLSVLSTFSLPLDSTDEKRRETLANWIVSPENPMTARVLANRIWQGHFGTGLVDTPSDFGRSGTKPTHPELLDWLARELIRSGWSIKQMHRLIVLSATYRQASTFQSEAALKDADVRLLWSYPTRRMDAETIRDSMLAVSGRLNLKMYGRGFDLFDLRGGLTGFKPVESFSGDGLRRMIYAHKVRREREAVFGAFDCPDAGQATSKRRESTTPIQALNLFNSRFTIDESKAFAERVVTESGNDLQNQIKKAYELALSRSPTEMELANATPVVQKFGLATLCRALYNSNEFLFMP